MPLRSPPDYAGNKTGRGSPRCVLLKVQGFYGARGVVRLRMCHLRCLLRRSKGVRMSRVRESHQQLFREDGKLGHFLERTAVQMPHQRLQGDGRLEHDDRPHCAVPDRKGFAVEKRRFSFLACHLPKSPSPPSGSREDERFADRELGK